MGTFGGTGRASCRKLVRKAAWTPGEPGLQSWQEHRGSQQKEIFLSAHLVQGATHFVFVLKLGSKHSHPKEKYKGILKLQEPISSDKIKFQTSDKLIHEEKKNKPKPTRCLNHSLCSDATPRSVRLSRSSFLQAHCRFFWGWGQEATLWRICGP